MFTPRIAVLLGLWSHLQVARAVTIYTTLTDNNGSTVLPTNTNTATGPAYTGYTGMYHLLLCAGADPPTPPILLYTSYTTPISHLDDSFF